MRVDESQGGWVVYGGYKGQVGQWKGHEVGYRREGFTIRERESKR